MNAVVLFSGGIDSTVLVYDLIDQGAQVETVGVDYGQPHRIEMEHAARLAHRLDVNWTVLPLDIGFLGRTTDGVVFPNRNAILVSLAAAYAVSIGFDTVAAAMHADDHARFPDCRPAWADAMCDVLLKATDGQVRFHRPYIRMRKSEIVARGRMLGVPFSDTWSCYGPGPSPCGECLACEGRDAALLGE